MVNLLDFIPQVSPKYSAPPHLKAVADVFTRIASGEPVRVLLSMPPRHSKTETLLHAIGWLLAQRPDMRIAFSAYQARLSEKKSRRALDLAERAGVPTDRDQRSKRDWRTGIDEGGLWATSVNGPITGEGFDLILADDLLKGRAAAESGIIRENTHSWLISDVMTRLEPDGAVIVSGTRWHCDDPIARLAATGEWEVINLPALAEADDPIGRQPGEALWPTRWTQSALHRICETLGGPDSYEWRALYQGDPMPRGSRVFGDTSAYQQPPPLHDCRISIGLDFAYSSKKSADASVAVVLSRQGETYYVLDCCAVREPPAVFMNRVKLLCTKYPNATCFTYTAATEAGSVGFFRSSGIPITHKTATVDKFSRAIATAAAWNRGSILVPERAAWLDSFVSELASFSGLKDRHDDQVDALVAAFDHLHTGGGIDWEWSFGFPGVGPYGGGGPVAGGL